MMIGKSALAAGALALAFAGVALAADKDDHAGGAAPKAKNECFWTRMVDGFAAPDQNNLYVRVGVRDVYHLEMFAPCQDIDWDQRVALVSRTGGSICDALDVEVIAHAPGLGRQRCSVRRISKLTPEQIAALPKRAKP